MLLELQQSWGSPPVLSFGHTPIVLSPLCSVLPSSAPSAPGEAPAVQSREGQWPSLNQDPHIPYSKTASHSQSVCMSRVDPTHLQNQALVLIILHVVGGCLDLFLVHISMLVL